MTIQASNHRFSSPCGRGLHGSVAAVLGALAVSSLLLACGGGSSVPQPGGGGEGSSDVGAGGEPSHTENAAGQAEAGAESNKGEGGAPLVNCDDRPTQSVTLDQPIWQTGFKVTLGTATLKPQTASCSPGLLTIDAQFENRGTDTQTFDAVTLLSSAGKDYELPYGQDLPRVPGARLGKGSFAFEVDDTFSLDDATLSFGGPERHQAKVPFGKDSPDPLITLEPQILPITGKVVAGYLNVNFEDAVVRADAPWSYSSIAANEVYLTLDYSAMVTRDMSYGDYLSDDAFVLKLPDGTSIAPDSVPRQYVTKKGVTVSDLWVGFSLPAPASGKYSLEVKEVNGVEAPSGTTAQFPFTLPTFPTFGDK